MPQSSNRILNSLPQNVFAAVEPHLQEVKLPFADVIAEPGEPVGKVYFPTAGIVSLVVEMKVGEMIETAMVGRDGVVNGTAALDSKIALHKGIVQVEGSAVTISPDVLRNLAHEFGPLQSLLIRHEQVLLAQAQQQHFEPRAQFGQRRTQIVRNRVGYVAHAIQDFDQRVLRLNARLDLFFKSGILFLLQPLQRATSTCLFGVQNRGS